MKLSAIVCVALAAGCGHGSAKHNTAPDENCAGDADSDNICDGDDQCPNEAETFNGVDDTDGCPEAAKPAPSP